MGPDEKPSKGVPAELPKEASRWRGWMRVGTPLSAVGFCNRRVTDLTIHSNADAAGPSITILQGLASRLICMRKSQAILTAEILNQYRPRVHGENWNADVVLGPLRCIGHVAHR